MRTTAHSQAAIPLKKDHWSGDDNQVHGMSATCGAAQQLTCRSGACIAKASPEPGAYHDIIPKMHVDVLTGCKRIVDRPMVRGTQRGNPT